MDLERPATDTRRYQTHAEWCAYLSSRGMLKTSHRQCPRFSGCVAPPERKPRGEVSWRTPRPGTGDR